MLSPHKTVCVLSINKNSFIFLMKPQSLDICRLVGKLKAMSVVYLSTDRVDDTRIILGKRQRLSV